MGVGCIRIRFWLFCWTTWIFHFQKTYETQTYVCVRLRIQANPLSYTDPVIGVRNRTQWKHRCWWLIISHQSSSISDYLEKIDNVFDWMNVYLDRFHKDRWPFQFIWIYSSKFIIHLLRMVDHLGSIDDHLTKFKAPGIATAARNEDGRSRGHSRYCLNGSYQTESCSSVPPLLM